MSCVSTLNWIACVIEISQTKLISRLEYLRGLERHSGEGIATNTCKHRFGQKSHQKQKLI
ncbi:MAG: hypothetical protein C5B52_17680 [Bacteroidetes bacterium]|nr:MAG: hypothetical protein C5B52_17680 [Bacteroidota bacterium]